MLPLRRRGGFLLPLAALLLAAGAIAGANIARVAVQNQRIQAAQKAAAEIQAVQSAARRYLEENGSWPASIDELKAAGYLESSWAADNPWGNPYALETTGDWLVVRTELPAGVHPYLKALLPAAGSNGDVLRAATLPPAAAGLNAADFIAKAGQETDRTMGDDLLMDGNRITDVGDAQEAGDLLSLGMAEDRYVNNTGDTMTGDLVVNARVESTRYSGPGDTGDVMDPHQTSTLGNHHTVQDVYLRSLGLWVSQWEPRPKNWTCTEGSDNISYSCCPPGYILMSHSISNSSGGYLWWDGSRFCAGGGGAPAGTRTVCCR